MKGLNLNGFKKVGANQRSTILKHADGHKIHIAHEALSPKMRKDLNDLPLHLEEGGDVPESKSERAASARKFGMSQKLLDEIDKYPVPNEQRGLSSAPDQPKEPSFMDKIGASYDAINTSFNRGLKSLVGVSDAEAAPQEGGPAPASVNQIPQIAPAQQFSQPAQTQMQPAAAAPANPDPYGYDALSKGILHGIGEQKSGMQQQAAAIEQQGAADVATNQTQIDNQQRMMADYQAHYNSLQKEYQAVLSDVKNSHIDPKHFMESKSALGKVSTAIGLLMGGMGGGLTHQENPAMKFLNAQIDRDIEAQKANLGKSENLLSANVRQFGNLHDATNMTYVMQNGIYANQLRMAAAKASGPMARGKLMEEAGKLDERSAPVLQQMAMKRAMMNGMNDPRIDPATKIRNMTMAGIIQPGEQDQMFKELNAVQNHAAQTDAVMKYFDQAAKDNTLVGRAGRLGYEPPSIGALQSAMMPYLKDAEGRISEVELERTDKLLPQATDADSTKLAKRQALSVFLHEKSPPVDKLRAHGINPEQFGRFNAQGNKKIQLGPPVKR